MGQITNALAAAAKKIAGKSPNALLVSGGTGRKGSNYIMGVTDGPVGKSVVSGLNMIGLSSAAKWLKGAKVREFFGKALTQDTPIHDILAKGGIQRLRKHLKANPGAQVYLDINTEWRTKKLMKQLQSAFKGGKANVYNMGPTGFHQSLEDKMEVAKYLGRYGAGGDMVIGKNVRKFLADPKNKNMFIKQRYGLAGRGVQSRAGALTPKQIAQIVREHRTKGGQYMAQRGHKLKPGLGGGKPAEYRVHAVDGKIMDVTPRWGVAGYFSPLEKAKVQAYAQKAMNYAVRKNKNFRKGVWGLDVSLTDKGRPIVHEIQENSGFMGIPGAFGSSYGNFVKATTGQDLIGKRLAKRMGAAGALGGAAVLGTSAMLPDQQPPPKASTQVA